MTNFAYARWRLACFVGTVLVRLGGWLLDTGWRVRNRAMLWHRAEFTQ